MDWNPPFDMFDASDVIMIIINAVCLILRGEAGFENYAR